MRRGDPPRPEVKVGDWNTLDMVEDTDMAWTSLHGRRCGNSWIHPFASGRILKPSCVKDTLDVLDHGFAASEKTGRRIVVVDDEPGVLAGVPLHQFAHSGAARPPLMDLVHALPAGMPQLAFEHPTPHRLAFGMNVVLTGQILRRQCGSEAPIALAAQYLRRVLLRLLSRLTPSIGHFYLAQLRADKRHSRCMVGAWYV